MRYSGPLAFTFLIFLSFFISCKENVSTEMTIDQKIDDLLSQAYEKQIFNGTVLIAKKGEVVYKGAYGLSNIDPETPMKVENIFRLASVSKQFTCMTIMMLKEEGKLDYDQDVKDFIPELPYEGITLRHLMNHTSGIPDYVELFDVNWKTDLEDDDPAKLIKGNDHMLSLLVEHKPERKFAPGEKWEYSNSAYLCLAIVTERVSGISFSNFAKERIFDPLGMSSTSFYDFVPGPDPNMPLRAFGFTKRLDGTRSYNDTHYLNSVKGDGGIFSTVEDLYKWDRALYTEKLVKKETLEEAFTPGKLANGELHDYGFGWTIGKSISGKKTVAHGGGWVGFRTYIHREIEEDHSIIFLSNHTSNYMEPLLYQLKNILHGKSYIIPKEMTFEKIGKSYFEEGVDAGMEKYKELKADLDKNAMWGAEFDLWYLANVLKEEDKSEEALSILQLIIDEYAEKPGPYLRDMGNIQGEMGNKELALKHYELALNADPNITGVKNKIQELQEN
ncbi:MAG: serine hydrolase [Bacteroidia bacterium]|nr:serine hydrolase [Bacteroidia bacterium]